MKTKTDTQKPMKYDVYTIINNVEVTKAKKKRKEANVNYTANYIHKSKVIKLWDKLVSWLDGHFHIIDSVCNFHNRLTFTTGLSIHSFIFVVIVRYSISCCCCCSFAKLLLLLLRFGDSVYIQFEQFRILHVQNFTHCE